MSTTRRRRGSKRKRQETEETGEREEIERVNLLGGPGTGIAPNSGHPPDDKIKRLAEERTSLQEEIKQLTVRLEEEKLKEKPSPNKSPQMNGPEMQLYEVQREASKQIHEYKLKLQKAEQEMTNLEGTVMRLETQVKRFKYDAEEAEKLEDELKTDRRRLQREVRECQTQIEELSNQNKHLNKRLEKIRQTRSALGVQ